MSADTADISRWQGVIPVSVFAQWRAAGISRVVVKIGGGDAGRYKDSCFDANRANALAAGMAVDGYWFNGVTDPVADVQFAHSIAPGIRIWFDVESEKFATHTMPHWTPAQLNAAAQTAANLGHPVGCYMSSSVTTETNWSSCTWIPLWVANYSARSVPKVGYWSAPVMWQYTSKGNLPGHSGYLDLSVTLAAIGGTAPLEDDMTPEEHNMLKAVHDAVFVGGDSMPDAGRSIGQSLQGLTNRVSGIGDLVELPVPRDGQTLSQAQDNMNTGTLVRHLAQNGVPVDVNAVAAAVIAQLPASGASLTQEQVKQAVIDGVSALTIKASA